MACGSESTPTGKLQGLTPSPILVSPDTTTGVATPLHEAYTPTLIPTNTPAPTSTPTPAAGFILDKNANIRSGPGQEFIVVAGAVAGDTLSVFGKNADGTWLLIDPVKYLWISASLGKLDQTIDLIPLAQTPAPTLPPAITLTPFPTITRTPIPSKTPVPSRTPIPAVLIIDIYNNFQTMTALQFREYTAQIAGRSVRERIVVANVDENGRVNVKGPWYDNLFNIYEFCVVVSGVPNNIAIGLNGGDNVYLEATINGIVGDYNYYYNCENTVVLYYVSIGE
jgi:hypothetical protein